MKIHMDIEFDSLKEAADFMNGRLSLPVSPQGASSGTLPSGLTKLPPTPRANVSPGESPITKMGADMKKAMLAAVGSNAFAPNYKGKSLKYLQLLWKRGEICFDGKEFYKK